jgi:hypothetical protein
MAGNGQGPATAKGKAEKETMMRQMLRVMILSALALLGSAVLAFAEDRADWGVAVSVGADSGTASLLLKNDTGYHLLAVDLFGKIVGAGLASMTFSDIRPGDRIDYALSPFGGMDICDVLYVTPRRQAEATD